MLASVEFNSFVEWRFFGEFNKSSSFWFSIISSQKFNFSYVSAFTEEVSDITIISLERESSNANFKYSLLVFINHFWLWLRLLFSNWLSSNNRLRTNCFFRGRLFFAFVTWWLFGLGDYFSSFFGNRFLFRFFIRIRFRLNWLLGNNFSDWLFSNWLCFFRWLLRRFNGRFFWDWFLSRGFSFNNWGFYSLFDWFLFLRFFRFWYRLSCFLDNRLLNWWSNFLDFLRLNYRCFFFRLFWGRLRGFLLLNNSFLNWGFDLGNNLFRSFFFTFFLRWFLLCWFFGNRNNLFGWCSLNLNLLGWFFLNNWGILFFRGFLFSWNLLGNFLLLNFLLLGWFGCNDGNWTIWIIFRCLNR